MRTAEQKAKMSKALKKAWRLRKAAGKPTPRVNHNAVKCAPWVGTITTEDDALEISVRVPWEYVAYFSAAIGRLAEQRDSKQTG